MSFVVLYIRQRSTLAGVVLLSWALVGTLSCSAGANESGSQSAEGVPEERGIQAHFPGPSTGEFEPCASAAIFVGFGDFEELHDIRFAFDDAVDLAHLFALELEIVCPERVHVLFSGELQKPASAKRRDQLREAGAEIYPGRDVSDVIRAVLRQARSAGSNGLLLITFSTHGISFEGNHYLLAPSSLREAPVDSGLEVGRVLQFTKESEVTRRLLLIDACREILTPARSGVGPDPLSAMGPLPSGAEMPHGQALLLAAPEGKYAYDDERLGNGVFTLGVIEALRCRAKTDQNGLVTIYTTAEYANDYVTRWMRINRPPAHGIDKIFSDEGGRIPLSLCRGRTPVPPDESPRQPPELRVDENVAIGDFGEILQPTDGAHTTPVDTVRARVFQPGFYAAVLIRPHSSSDLWVQNNGRWVGPNEDVEIRVSYGGPDRFQVYLGLTQDPDLFKVGQRLARRPLQDAAGRPVQWLGPVEVEAVYEQ